MRKKKRRRGMSYAKRVADINAIYDTYSKTGLSNREIWKRYVWPRWGVSERTFYNLLKAPGLKEDLADRERLLREGFLFPELLFNEAELRGLGYYKKDP